MMFIRVKSAIQQFDLKCKLKLLKIPAIIRGNFLYFEEISLCRWIFSIFFKTI